MAARPANKGQASIRRAGGLADADVVGTFEDPGARAEAKRRDNAQGAAYRQGQAAARRRVQETGRRRGHKPTQVHDDPQRQQLYEAGFGDELTGQRQKARTERLAPITNKAGGVAHDGAGVLLGMVAYALFLAYVKGGWSGVTGWLGAKFVNKTSSATPPASSSPKSGLAPGGGTAGGGGGGGGGGTW